MHLFSACAPVLVVAAHPDDEVLGCGAAMARLADAGREVHVVYMATGAAARYEDLEAHAQQIQAEVTALRADARAAGKILGVASQQFFDFPDNRLDTIPLMDLSHALRKVVVKVEPGLVLTHHHGDYNWDHTAVFKATLMACRANAGDVYPDTILTYEVLSSTERGLAGVTQAFLPQVYLDAAAGLERKVEALTCYTSELGSYPHPRSPEAVKNLAARRGNEVGLKCAEAFQLVRAIER